MILRALELDDSADRATRPIWTEIERTQQQDFSSGCWLVPQPAHAALSGDIAARLDPEKFPGVTPEVQKAFALHDSGWSLLDASAIQESRSRGAQAKLLPFLAADPADIVEAWSGSIAIAGKASPLGGYLVSRHFSSIGKLEPPENTTKRGRLIASFIEREDERQNKLRKKLPQSAPVLDRLLEALQFCDLLSLYLACGVTANVEFPQLVGGVPIRLSFGDGSASISPSPFTQAVEFTVSAIRHPRSKLDSSATFSLLVK